MDDKDNKLVVYDHKTGESLILDKTTNTISKILPRDLAVQDLLKDADGRYRTEIKMECKRLYFSHVTVPEISERTGVKEHVLSRWIYGYDRNSSDPRCWRVQKRRMLEESREKNLETYVTIEKSALGKIHEYLTNPKTLIANSRQFKEFAEGIAKLLYVPGGSKDSPVREATSKTQININTQVVNPLTPEEAREILVTDPIRVINTEPKE